MLSLSVDVRRRAGIVSSGVAGKMAVRARVAGRRILPEHAGRQMIENGLQQAAPL
ncbi:MULTISPECIES: hypothetical protein [Brenneria]|uniref:hypothetical protein n=1 Tax=Brenneria TaxID=71655 RepID=UPI0012EA9B62|nr:MULTISPECIES: hypothetical protein [Brenneria]